MIDQGGFASFLFSEERIIWLCGYLRYDSTTVSILTQSNARCLREVRNLPNTDAEILWERDQEGSGYKQDPIQ